MEGKIRASHILVDEKQKAGNLKEQIDNGKEFSKCAREASNCPSAEKGGDLGFFGEGEMVKPFERKAESLEIGEVSEPVKTKFGYHLIRKEDEK